MAGRYVFTPARRAALKKAAAKSAAKRRKNRANGKAYRSANRAASRKINQDFARGKYTKPGVRGLGDALAGRPRKRAQAAYDRAKNNNAVKYKGKKHRSDRYLRNKRRAVNVATGVAGASLHVGLNYASYRANQSEYEKTARRNQKAAKKRYNEDRKQSLKARKRNLAGAGLNRHGEPKRRRKPVKVTSHRLPGQAMIGSKR